VTTHDHHTAAFLALIDEARPRVKELSVAEYGARLMRREQHVLIDVREDHEWALGHLPGAMHLGRGIIERDIESLFADRGTPLVLYCGGGYRSVLVADSLQKMGYRNVVSLAGVFRGWEATGLVVEKDET
jgi:rhodanese-related sulfurtransferase